MLPENLTEDFMAVLSQYYSQVLFSNTLCSILSQYYIHISVRLTGHGRFWTSATDTASLSKAKVRINNICA
jgi:hypothetical protein